MAKILTGIVVSTAMTNTVVVEVTRHVPHPLYKKLQKRSKKHKADSNGQSVTVGQTVKIIETKPISKGKHFKLYVAQEPVKETKEVKQAVTKEAKPKATKTKKEAKKA